MSWEVHTDVAVEEQCGVSPWGLLGLMCYFSLREGALTFFFWFALQIPESQQKEVTAERVNTMLHRELSTRFNSSGSLSYQPEYRLNPDSLILLGKCHLLAWGLSSQRCSKIYKVLKGS